MRTLYNNNNCLSVHERKKRRSRFRTYHMALGFGFDYHEDDVEDDEEPGGDNTWMPAGCLQLCLTRLRGGPIGGICWVANARNASAIRCGCVWIIDFHPGVSITSVA